MATSGIEIPASCACRCTVLRSQLSAALRGVSMTCAPVRRFADHFEMASDMNDPEKPMTAEKISNACRSSWVPCSLSIDSMPSSCMTTDNTTSTAMFVPRNSRILFIRAPNSQNWLPDRQRQLACRLAETPI